MPVFLVIVLASMAYPALGWGMFGHQITATIAQIYLLPSAHKAICDILLGTYKCNLAGVASWPDEIKQDGSYKEYSNLHFVNDANDDPPNKCVFGDSNWKDKNHVLKGIVDMAREVAAPNNKTTFPNRDHALRFLVHFLGDIHQPYHLTGQYRGANQVLVKWQGKETNLHFVWDDSFIDYQVLFVNGSEYTGVLPTSNVNSEDAKRNERIEAVLKGLNYDPYIRYILLEGVYKRWKRDVQEWITCPETNDMNLGLGEQSILGNFSTRFQDPTDLKTVCPLHWANQTHPLLCATGIWPKGLTDKTPHEELSGDYATTIREALIIEKQLAMGGIRLASVLNGLFGTPKDRETYGIIPFP